MRVVSDRAVQDDITWIGNPFEIMDHQWRGFEMMQAYVWRV
jgi:hypothetical protein